MAFIMTVPIYIFYCKGPEICTKSKFARLWLAIVWPGRKEDIGLRRRVGMQVIGGFSELDTLVKRGFLEMLRCAELRTPWQML